MVTPACVTIRFMSSNPSKSAPLFEVSSLSKRYGNTTVVDDLSFEIAAGECLGVIVEGYH